MVTRREFIKLGGVTAASMYLTAKIGGVRYVLAALPGGSLDPTGLPKFTTPMVIPPAMPRTSVINGGKGQKKIDYYEIAVRQFDQQILPAGSPATTVWSYGSLAAPGTVAQGGSFNYPAFTIEAKWEQPVRVKWVNDLVDQARNYLPHLLPVDQTLHWANPPMESLDGNDRTDSRGLSQDPYEGPVPIVTHVHGAHTYQESDGYPEAWYLPAANDIPDGYATGGTFYEQFKGEFLTKYGEVWAPGSATFQYPNDQRATTLWYHDHSLGITRLNVYAGPAGFYLLRGGPDDAVLDAKGKPAVLPGPAPALGDPPGIKYYEIPIVIQDRSFNDDGSLFYPDHRAFFEDLGPEQLDIPFIPDAACDGEQSDVSPIWNPEFFGNTMVVNGNTWPFLEVDQRRYRFRLLNGCQSRFLILDFSAIPGVEVWHIGTEGGFLPAPLNITLNHNNRLLVGPAERFDVLVDFNNVPAGNYVLHNLGPDEPFGGGTPEIDFDPADPATTGQVMQFNVLATRGRPDQTTPPAELVLPPVVPLVPTSTRKVSLNEEESKTVRVLEVDGNVILACDDPGAEAFGPTSALLGTLDDDGNSVPLLWMDDETEKPFAGTTEMWEIYNFTADAHPIHVHLVQFQVVNRQGLEVDDEGMATQPAVLAGDARPPEAWETGWKDTVIAYPGEVTRIQARFDIPGLFVWHCHILEHEDNEMMRPYRVLP